MVVKVEISSEDGANLLSQAQIRGLSLEAFLTKIAQQQSRLPADPAIAAEEWERELDALVAISAESPLLPEEAMNRHSYYSDRG